MLGSNAQHKDTRGKRVGMYEINSVSMISAMGSTQALSSIGSSSDSLSDGSESKNRRIEESKNQIGLHLSPAPRSLRALWSYTLAGTPTNLNYPISWTNRYRIESKTWINQVALREGLDSEESDARHSAHGSTGSRRSRTGSRRMDQIRGIVLRQEVTTREKPRNFEQHDRHDAMAS
ncbi:unnamed protein product [Prunus brigantina]